MAIKQSVAVIGGGASGIMCACHLDTEIYDVTLIEKTSRLGRKLLVAGEGGFNLSYDESPDDMVGRYYPSSFVEEAIHQFSCTDLREWLSTIGIETYVGTSNRVFPEKGIKPYEVVSKMITLLEAKKMNVLLETTWKGWNDKNLILLETANEVQPYKFDHVVFALGGSSWKKTGSDGSWLEILKAKGIECNSFQASNCLWKVEWKPQLLKEVEGRPLKNIITTVGSHHVKGEALITADGIEGGAIYAQAYAIRQAIATSPKKEAILSLDLKPDLDEEVITTILAKRQKSVKHTLLHKLNLCEVSFQLILAYTTKETYNAPVRLAAAIKHLKLVIKESGDLDDAISTVGGAKLSEVDENYELNKIKNHFATGEMLDWDTRTGGYLLQACFSMGIKTARHLNNLTRD